MVKRSTSVILFFVYTLISTASFGQQFITDSLKLIELADSAFTLQNVNFKNAQELSDYVLKQAKIYKSNNLIKKALYTSAYLDWFNGDHLPALEKSKQSLNLSKQVSDTFMIAENYTLRGLIYLYLSNYDSSLQNFEKGLYNFSILNDTAQVLRNYGFLGLVYTKQANYLKAKENLMEQVVLQRQFNTPEWNVIRFDNDQNSKKYFIESLINAKENLKNYPENSRPSKNKRFANRNVGLIFRELGNIDSALYYLKKSAAVAAELNADIIWFDIAKTYNVMGLYDSAFWAAKKSIEDAKDHGTRIILSYSYSALGHIYISTKQLKKGILEYKKALELEKIMLHKSAQMKLMLNIARKYEAIGMYQTALLYTDSSLVIAQKIGARNDIANALKAQFKTLKKLNNFKKAVEVKEVYDILLDSLQKGKVQFDLAKFDLYNEVELNKLEINALNKQQALFAANLKNRTLVIIIISIIVLSTVVLLLFNFFRTKKLQKLNTELNKQQKIIGSQNFKLVESNKEKELLLGEIHHRVKNNLQTITSLLNIQQRKLKDPESIKVIEDSKNRVMAMGLIHQHLYQNDTFAEIDFKNYTKELVRVLINTNSTTEIAVKCKIPALKIELDNAIFFGLIINELAINSIKHAFNGVKKPLLKISIFEDEDKMALLVKDNGQTKDIVFDNSNSFGWKMVNNICEKLEGEIIVDNSEGLSVKILFSKDIISLA